MKILALCGLVSLLLCPIVAGLTLRRAYHQHKPENRRHD